MPQTLALIHTSQIFLVRDPVFQDLIAELLPGVRIVNILDDSLLPGCMGIGHVTPEITRRMCSYVVAAESLGADAVLSLCSSLGPAIDSARKLVSIPVIKVDDAHTEEAVRKASRIGVMATVASTLKPTVGLVLEKASAAGKTVTVIDSLTSAAFEALTSGDRGRHDELLMESAMGLAPKVDLLLLAQASMTRLAPSMAEATGLPVLSSPRPAVEKTRDILREASRTI